MSTSAGSQDYGYDLSGRRSTVWVPGSTNVNAVQYYAGAARVAYWTASDGNIHFEHQDWLGTERMRTSATSAVDGSYSSLPYGDNLQVSGSDTNSGHFAMLDQDVSASSGLSHAMFREYSETAGRWMSPDPYSGSYQPGNPQSFNRYVYALNNTLSYADPDGLDCVYFSDAGNTVEEVDTDSDSSECGANGGNWVNGSVTGGYYNSSNDSWTFTSSYDNGAAVTTTVAPGSTVNGVACYGNCDTSYSFFGSAASLYYGSSVGASPGPGGDTAGAIAPSSGAQKPYYRLPYPATSVLSPHHDHDQCVNGVVLTTVGTITTVGAAGVIALAAPELAGAAAVEESAGETFMTFVHGADALGHLLVAPLFAVGAGADMMAQSCGH